MIRIAIDGTDSSGKTPLTKILTKMLQDVGDVVEVVEPYRLTAEVFPLWAEDPCLAAFRIVEGVRLREVANGTTVLIYDRHWPTAAVSTDNQEALGLFKDIPVDISVLLLGSPEATRKKRDRLGLTSPWVQDQAIAHYQQRYRTLPVNPFATKHLVFNTEHSGLEGIATKIMSIL